MRNRVLKPGDTRLMSPDEEYCRLIYERLWNTPDAFNLSVELYDKGGVRVRKTYKKITAQEEQGILSRVIGEGWEPLFVQDYEDWAIRIQKRPRSSSIYASSPPTTREFLLRALIIGLLLLTVGWLIAQAVWRADPARNPALLEPGTDADSDLNADLEPGAQEENEGEALAPDLNDDGEEDELLGDADDADDLDADAPTAGADSPEDDSLAEPDAAAESDEPEPGGETPAAEPDDDSEDPAVGDADEDEDGPFEQAVRLAQQAVLGGRVADTPAEWEELADQWQQAADLMADIPEEDDRYDIAQDRVERYEANRAIALSEAEKLRDAE